MPSNQFLLAFQCKAGMSESELNVRTGHVESYVKSLVRSGDVNRVALGDLNSGFVSWISTGDKVRWPHAKVEAGRGAAWPHFPTLVGGSSSDPIAVAERIALSREDVGNFGAPFACVFWKDGALHIVNDAWGLARIYEFRFDGITVWSTRPAMAHIFAGERIAKNAGAWAGMATAGWNVGGSSHYGIGRQLPPRSRVVASHLGGVSVLSDFNKWITHWRYSSLPSLDSVAEGMTQTIANAKWYPKEAVADLSGGKDSRVIAAAALRANAVSRVRTVRTDHGEVETAQELVRRFGGEVEHNISEVAPRVDEAVESLPSRIASLHRAFEGSYLAATAVKAVRAFQGFAPSSAARFNGLGGEAVQGGTLLSEHWRKELEGKPLSHAEDRIRATIFGPAGVSEESRQIAYDCALSRLSEAREVGIDSAVGGVDFFYNLEKMPYWSNTFANRSTIMPFYTGALLPYMARAHWEPIEYGEFHRSVLRRLIPEWAEVPFYKPSAKTRATVFLWETGDWPSVLKFIGDRAGEDDSFDRDMMSAILKDVRDGSARARHEGALARLLWELSGVEFLSDVNSRVDAVVSSVARRTSLRVNATVDGNFRL